ncbi:glycosyltransferase family 4 protein [Pseudomonas sp. PSE14]|uniref:glycosyltransferase family 4 protein n=1 Tax=Pseudomonas sp. PSE14 TaxID=3016341 RepID=UPI0023D7EE2B|nr:glycosyltransferase family 4 protein [Pseudomonas sp. PSE14]WEJ70761.1 glycosyltransferase family 4 protein [Pseudomonas sp. PSE14]
MKFHRMAVVSNQAFSIFNFRGDLIRDLVSRGVAVFALAPDYDEWTERQIRALGAIPVTIRMDRVGLSPLSAIKVILELAVRLRALKVDAVLSYFAKPVIYGGLAARMSRVNCVYSLIEGAGYVYSENAVSISRALLKALVSGLYRLALGGSSRVFLLNADDYQLFVGGRLVDARKVTVLPGIGLDLQRFREEKPVIEPVIFSFVGRLLREKGVVDFVAAAKLVKAQYPSVEFVVVGDVDVNPNSVFREEINQWVEEGVIRWVGRVTDVRGWLASTSVLVYPSYYREGMPRTIQEAMAIGRPIITTDSVGCRESIEDEVNGFLVPVRSPHDIAKCMEIFIKNPLLIAKMGRESRRIAEVRFDVRKINEKMISCFS